MQPQAITRKAQWAEEDAALSKFHADKRAAMGPADLVAPAPSKPRAPKRSLLTAHFTDLDSHPAFTQHFNVVLIDIALVRTRDKHTRGPIRGLLG